MRSEDRFRHGAGLEQAETEQNSVAHNVLNMLCKMCVTICGRFRQDEVAVAGYGNRIRVKYTAKWGVQIAGMIFQTRSTPDQSLLLPWTFKIIETSGGTL